MRILLTGGTGMLGVDLRRAMQAEGHVVDCPNRNDLDLSSGPSIDAFFLNVSADWIVNCAAYTKVDEAESEQYEANYLNAVAPFTLARHARRIGARILHLSTDFVFDGAKQRPYTETDEPNPIGNYGRSKLQGERLLQKENPDGVVVRTAWLFGASGKCFPRTILSAFESGRQLRVVDDQVGSPTYTRDLSEAITNLIGNNAPPGVYHIVNAGQASWRELAVETIFAHLLRSSHSSESRQEESELRARAEAAVLPIRTEDWPTKAQRPNYSVLCTDKYCSLGFERLPDWRDAVARFVSELQPLPA